MSFSCNQYHHSPNFQCVKWQQIQIQYFNESNSWIIKKKPFCLICLSCLCVCPVYGDNQTRHHHHDGYLKRDVTSLFYRLASPVTHINIHSRLECDISTYIYILYITNCNITNTINSSKSISISALCYNNIHKCTFTRVESRWVGTTHHHQNAIRKDNLKSYIPRVSGHVIFSGVCTESINYI